MGLSFFELRRRHQHLRQTYVTLWVCEDGSIVDGHKHYMQGAGWTEHQLFLAEAIDSKGFLRPIPQGPKAKVAGRKKGKKMSRSERTRAMLGPPQEILPAKNPLPPLPPQPWAVEKFLPGLAQDAGKLPYLSCIAAASEAFCDATCLAVTKSGVQGNLCQQHYNDAASDQSQAAFWRELQDLFESARDGWHEHQVELAVSLSLEEATAQEQSRQESLLRVDRRLAAEGLQRVATPAEGDCMFIAVAWSAGLAIDPYAFRQEVVSYLTRFSAIFKPWFDASFKDYDNYLRYLSRQGAACFWNLGC